MGMIYFSGQLPCSCREQTVLHTLDGRVHCLYGTTKNFAWPAKLVKQDKPSPMTELYGLSFLAAPVALYFKSPDAPLTTVQIFCFSKKSASFFPAFSDQDYQSSALVNIDSHRSTKSGDGLAEQRSRAFSFQALDLLVWSPPKILIYWALYCI